MRRFWILLAVCYCALPFCAGNALALSPVIVNCKEKQNGGVKLSKHFSVQQLNAALASIPAEVKEYTSCYQAIESQLLRQGGKLNLNGSSGGGSGFPVILVVVIVVVLAGGGYGLYVARKR